MDRITDRIYLGDINGCSNLYQLRKNKITHILTMAAGIKPLYCSEFKYKVINIMDLPSQNIAQYFDKLNIGLLRYYRDIRRCIAKRLFGDRESRLELIFAHFTREAHAKERNILNVYMFHVAQLSLR